MRNVKTFLTNNDESIIKKMNSKSDIVEKKNTVGFRYEIQEGRISGKGP